MAIEEHGAGRQLVRLRRWPRCAPFGLMLTLVVTLVAFAAAIDGATAAAIVIAGIAIVLMLRAVWECASASVSLEDAARDWVDESGLVVAEGCGRPTQEG